MLEARPAFVGARVRLGVVLHRLGEDEPGHRGVGAVPAGRSRRTCARGPIWRRSVYPHGEQAGGACRRGPPARWTVPQPLPEFDETSPDRGFSWSFPWPPRCALPRATTEESAVRRGDVAFAQGNFEEALAEYRLAVRQGSDDPGTAGPGGAYLRDDGSGGRCGLLLRRAAARDPEVTDQAVSDLMRMARGRRGAQRPLRDGDRGGDGAVPAPGLGVGRMALALARHYFQTGEYGRALPFYQKAMAEATDSAPDIVFEVGQAYEEIGDCEHALVFFERFRAMVRPVAARRGRLVHRNLLVQPGTRPARPLPRRTGIWRRPSAWSIARWRWGSRGTSRPKRGSRRARSSSELGRCDEAMEAYAQVRYADQAGSLVDRAQARFDEIRFGRGLERLREGRCR